MLVCMHLLLDIAVSTRLEGNARKLNSRIIGGKRVNAKRYPYYTYLRLFFQSGAVSFCGGSLVNSDVILTAAHCIVKAKDTVVQIKAYVNYTESIVVTWNLTEYVFVRDVIAWIPHEKFDGTGHGDDIGLIILNKPVFEVSPVKYNNDSNLPLDGNQVTAIGHGYVSVGSTSGVADYLNEVKVPIVSLEDCNDSNSFNGNIVNESMICAGISTGGKDACYGDDGGPLLLTGGSYFEDLQVGLTSWGIGCGHPNYPGVYTRVSFFNEWIHDNICLYSSMKPSSCITSQPTMTPSQSPIEILTKTPTKKPLKKPTKKPLKKPTKKPTKRPSMIPTMANVT
jgi:trypsin